MRLKRLTPKQFFQSLPIALAQIKTGNSSENLLNEIYQIINCLYLFHYRCLKVKELLVRNRCEQGVL